ncbi:hypothetical protein DET1578 [Dehalococcoides mccartyi 195]|uniref:Uncharacterized protein n=1 Tax=Dehalococcoides mccartyi (strain ATCC BAA-2266 / KCTC 15142 / 195) TaxID=243164 RepID=Q3Z674_DEHM1|nr:hypothetical protein DET1578 [Dehalococcoides mccartyi 195]
MVFIRGNQPDLFRLLRWITFFSGVLFLVPLLFVLAPLETWEVTELPKLRLHPVALHSGQTWGVSRLSTFRLTSNTWLHLAQLNSYIAMPIFLLKHLYRIF